jgi:hypothetical protein
MGRYVSGGFVSPNAAPTTIAEVKFNEGMGVSVRTRPKSSPGYAKRNIGQEIFFVACCS